MRRQFIRLAGVAMTAPFLASCGDGPQEQTAINCMWQKDPALKNPDGSRRNIVVQVNSSESLTLTSSNGDVGPLAGDTRRVDMRSYDELKTQPKISIKYVDKPKPPGQPMTAGGDADAKIERADVATIPGAVQELGILTGCYEDAKLLTPRATAAQVMPRPR
jgi:hypothetical protein